MVIPVMDYDSNGWWYANTTSTYYKSEWQLINRRWYYFNPDGYAVTGRQEFGGMYVTDASGAQAVVEF